MFSVFGEEPGLEIWVVGDHQISKLAKKKHGIRGLVGECHGSFHVQKSYIILHTSYASGLYHYKLHSWIGSLCPPEFVAQNEDRLQELKKGLEHEEITLFTREKERQESDEFLSYFDKELEYVEAVTLKETEGPNLLKKKLYQIKGRNNIHCRLVEPAAESLNSGDVFLLYDSFNIFQFNGRKSNKMERGKALDFGVQLRIEFNARVKVTLIDEMDNDCVHERNKFWATLLLERDSKGEWIRIDGHSDTKVTGETPTGLEKEISPPESGGDDETYENNYISSWKLYQIGSDSPPENLEDHENIESIIKFSPKGPTVDQLKEWNAYVLDCESEIFVWYGNLSSNTTRRLAREKGKKLMEENSRPSFAVLTKVRQRTEPYIFKEKFIGDWGDAFTDFEFDSEIKGNIAQLEQKEINIDCMYYPERYAIASEDARMPIPCRNKIQTDSLSLQVFIIVNNGKEELPEDQFGHFYNENCYIITIEMVVGKLTRNIIYFWQGAHSSREDRGLSALLSGNLAKNLRFCQVRRVIQNKEPEDFLSHFTPKMLVSNGKYEPNSPFLSSSRLYHIRGSNENYSHAVECPTIDASQLNSNDAFVLLQSKSSMIWLGCSSNQHEKDCANAIVERFNLQNNCSTFNENEESSEFWNQLNGKVDYNNGNEFKNTTLSAVMFECTNIIGIFQVYQVEMFSQTDLQSKNCILLDTGSTVFVWKGNDANEKCISMSIDTAEKYINYESDDTPKRENVSIVEVTAGEEPLPFKGYFHTWDPSL